MKQSVLGIFKLRLFLAIILVVSCANYQNSRSECAEILGVVDPSDLAKLSHSNTVTFVTKAYNLNQSEITIVPYLDGAVTYSWQLDNRKLALHIGQHNEKYLETTWLSRSPNIGEIRTCLGEPSLYQAYDRLRIDNYESLFSIWYPKRGLIAYDESKNKLVAQNVFSDGTSLPVIKLVVPDSLSNMLKSFYAKRDTTSKLVGELKSLRTWPAKYVDIYVDDSPVWLRPELN
jgi:hypothetical protein